VEAGCFLEKVAGVILSYLTSGYTQGDSDVISMPVGFRRHLVGKTLINVFFHYDIAEMRSVGKLVIKQTFSLTNGSNVI